MTVPTFVLVAVGPELTAYRLDADGASLTRTGSARLPAPVQYAAPNASGRTLYVASSDGAGGSAHHLTALGLDPVSGTLTPHGDPVALPARSNHLSLDPASEHVLLTCNVPAALRVYRIAPDGTPGGAVDELAPGDLGIYPHHVRVTPDAKRVIVVCRGNDATSTAPEDPGSLRVIAYEDGRLGAQRVVAPGGGYGFGPRDVDPHPQRPWLYASLERQNELALFHWTPAGDLEDEPRQRVSTLAAPRQGHQLVGAHQLVGPVHIHPRGHVAYVANRTPPRPDQAPDADNSLAVFALDPESGEASPLQHVDSEGLHPRTFQIDPTGTLLIAAHVTALGSTPAGLTFFRIAADGRLTRIRRQPVDTGPGQLFWMGIVTAEGVS